MVVEKVFAVIAESTRRDILEALAQDSKAVGQLVDELGVSQPTVSKHLRVLREAGVVTMRAQGQKRFYGINTEPLALVSTWLDSLGAGITENSGSPSAVVAGALTAVEVPAVASSKGSAFKPAAAAAADPAETGTKASPSVDSSASSSAAVASVAVAPGEPAAAIAPMQPSAAFVKQPAIVGVSNDGDGGVPRQLGRSVGRAAKKGADLLATFKRRKD